MIDDMLTRHEIITINEWGKIFFFYTVVNVHIAWFKGSIACLQIFNTLGRGKKWSQNLRKMSKELDFKNHF